MSVPTAPQAQMPTPTPAPAGKGAKNALIIGSILAVLFLVTTIVIFLLLSRAGSTVDSLNAQARQTKQQAGEVIAPVWCASITQDNLDNVEAQYDKYDNMDTTLQLAIDDRCKNAVSAARLVSMNTPSGSFTTTDSCEVDASSITCTGTVSRSSTSPGWSNMTGATVWLQLSFSQHQFIVGSSASHTVDLDPVTVDVNGDGTFTYTGPYDSSWGEYYSINTTKFFPTF